MLEAAEFHPENFVIKFGAVENFRWQIEFKMASR